MEILNQALQLILSLSILIVLHELGHFIPARLFGTRVEKFYLFFNPWFSLFKVKRGETEYGLGWIPLGGYVKIAGMIDESMDKEQMKQPPQEWEFRSKPAWQRLIIMIGGVTVNLILGYLIYMMVLFVWGKEYLSNDEVKYGIYLSDESLLAEGALQHGDKIISVGEIKPGTLNEANALVLIDGHRELTIERNGEIIKVSLPDDIEQTVLNKGLNSLFMPRVPFVIEKLQHNKPGEKAGLLAGDSLIGINQMNSPFFQDIVSELDKNKGKEVVVHVVRSGKELAVPVLLDENGKMGVYNKSLDHYFSMSKENYSLLEAIPAGIQEGNNTLVKYVKSLSLLFTPAGASQIGGFGSIGGLFSGEWDWQVFWGMTAFISIVLAFMNLLPIPALDGGHVLFLLYEIIRGKAPGERFMEIAQMIGMILLLGLILFANGNDLLKLFR